MVGVLHLSVPWTGPGSMPTPLLGPLQKTWLSTNSSESVLEFRAICHLSFMRLEFVTQPSLPPGRVGWYTTHGFTESSWITCLKTGVRVG